MGSRIKVPRVFLLNAGLPDDWRRTFVIVKAVPSVRRWHFAAVSDARCKMQDMEIRIEMDSALSWNYREAAVISHHDQSLSEKVDVCIKDMRCAVPRVTGACGTLLRSMSDGHVLSMV